METICMTNSVKKILPKIQLEGKIRKILIAGFLPDPTVCNCCLAQVMGISSENMGMYGGRELVRETLTSHEVTN